MAAALWEPLADWALAEQRRRGRMLVLGLCGPQGSGKSTAAEAMRVRSEACGARTAVLSLDDLYLGRAERARLANSVHPLLTTRGPPGTHNVALGERVLEALAAPGETALPRFDKAADDGGAPTRFVGPADVVIFEGWCVGARPQSDADLSAPVNDLEAEADPNGVWRRFVNSALGGSYQRLFARIDRLVLLRPPAFEVVVGWRREQERALGPRALMTPDQITRFVQHYERLSRWIDRDMPGRADVVVELDAARRVRSVVGL